MNKKNIYIHEIECISASDGELYLSTERTNIVINISNFIQDLGIITELTLRENNKEQKRFKESIKRAIKNN